MKFPWKFATLYVAFIATVAGLSYALITPPHTAATKAPKPACAEHIYVADKSPASWSRKSIRHDIPAWERAANGAFRKAWKTPSVCISLLPKRARNPRNAIIAQIVNKGTVQGALAYHTVQKGVPQITVYAGTGDFYGYSNSVSFTHELFELLADPSISVLDQGWESGIVYIGNSPNILPVIVDWATEVCDPVEAFSYSIKGVQISDWITRNWFADRMANQPYDHLHLIFNPYTILKGGYAQFYYGQWYAIENFGKGRGSRGFFLGESSRNVKVWGHE